MMLRRLKECSVVNTLWLFTIVLFHGTFADLLTDIEQCKPEQVHVSYGESPQEAIVMWSTIGPCSTKVSHGTKAFDLDTVTPGESRRFGEPWNKEGVKFIHRVKLRNLPSKSTIGFQPESNGVTGGTYFFHTPATYKPANESQLKEDWQFLVLGDLPLTSPVFNRLGQEAGRGHYSALLHPGNLAMNLSHKEGQGADLYLKLMEATLSKLPYLTAPGPAESDNGTFSQYRHRFSLPFTEWPMTLDRMWYSINIGPVHFVSYSTEVYKGEQTYAATQHNWLIKDLKVANANRKNTPWIVAFGHCPMYCPSQDPALSCNKPNSKAVRQLEDILYSTGVDVIISSSSQGSMVSYPMFKGVKLGDNFTHPLGPVHVSMAPALPWKQTYNSSNEEWLNFEDDDKAPLSFGRLRVYNSSRLGFELVSFESNQVLHSFDIVQHEHSGFSRDQLSANVSDQVDQQIKLSGGNPDVMDIHEQTSPKPTNTLNTITNKINEILQGDNHDKIIIGASVGGVILLILVAVLILRRVMRGKRRHSARRWETMDINYGKKYYNKAPEKDEMDQDFEIDMTETTQSRKLLSDD